MKIIEIQRAVDQQGQLTIPEQLLQDLGLVSGDMVKLAYISDANGSVSDSLKELVLTSNSIDTLADGEEDELTLPHELLEAAQISRASDLEVICARGVVVIMEADLLDSLPDELRELFDDLGISPDTVRAVMRNGGFANE